MSQPQLPPANDRKPFWKLVRRVSLGAGITLTATTLGGLWYATHYINTELAPQIERELSKQLQRPVQLGSVERAGLGGVTLGKSSIPATDTALDSFTIDRVDVQLDLWHYFRSGQVGVTINAEGVNAFIPQGTEPIITPPDAPPSPPPMIVVEPPSLVDLQKLKISNSQVTIRGGVDGKLVTIGGINANADLNLKDINNQTLALEMTGNFGDRGQIKIGGNYVLNRGSGRFQLDLVDIPSAPLASVLVGVGVVPQAGVLNASVGIDLAGKGLVSRVTGKLNLEGLEAQVAGLASPLAGVSGEVLFNSTGVTIPRLQANLGALTTKIKGSIGLDTGDLDLNLETNLTEIREIVASTGIQPAFNLEGAIQLKAQIKGTTARPEINAELLAPQNLQIDRVPLSNLSGKFSTRLSGSESEKNTVLQIDRLEADIQGGGKLQGQGQISPEKLAVEVMVEGVNAESIAELYDSKLPVTVGDIRGIFQVTGSLAEPRVSVSISAPNSAYPAEIQAQISSGVVNITSAQVSFPQGTAQVSGSYNLASGAWQGRVNADNFPLSLVSAEEQGTISVQADVNSRGSFDLADITGDFAVQLPQGFNLLPERISANGRWNGQEILLTNGQVSDLLKVQGTIGVDIPNGISKLNLAVEAERLAVSRLSLFIPNLPQQAEGTITFRGKLTGALASLGIDGNLNLEGVNLKAVSTALPTGLGTFVPSQGVLSFKGQVSGNLPAPRLIGDWRISGITTPFLSLAEAQFRGTIDPLGAMPLADGVLRLQDLVINDRPIASSLMGELSYRADRGLQANLEDMRGGTERLQVSLDENFLPLSLSAQLLGGTITARSQDQRLQVAISSLPLGLINERLAGRVSSDLTIDLRSGLTALGTIAVDQPRIGRALLDRLSANISFQNNQLQITDGNLRFPNQRGRYDFQLTYAPLTDQPFQAELTIQDGDLQELTSALQLREFSDLARSFDLPATTAQALASLPVFKTQGSLYQQVQYQAQLNARSEEQEILGGVNALFPPLGEFRGGLAGTVTVTTDRQFVPSVQFAVNASNLEYGKFAVDTFRMEGEYRSEVLSLKSLKLASGNSFAEISEAQLVPSLFGRPLSLESLSNLLATEQRAKIELVNFPIETLRPLPFYQAIPFDLTGNVNGQAKLSGTLATLKLDGNLSIDNATINRQSLELVAGDFSFQNFLLTFNGKALASGKEPLNAKGSLLVLGGILDMTVDVKDEGFAFLNILETPVRWVSGQGNASLVIKGSLNAPQIDGKVNIKDGRLALLGLEEELQQVQGELSFDRDRLNADLSANFSQGNFTAKGAVALNNPQLLTDNFLTINANQFRLNIRDLNAEQCSGTVIIQGTALNPVLTGELSIANGRLSLGDFDNTDTPLPGNVAFADLVLKLENMQITRVPIFNFVADGTITVNGDARTIRPRGRVNFSRGQFNAISARFRLDRSFDNFAEFFPNQGLNPSLNVRVSGSVAEVTRVPIITDPVLGPLSPRDVPVSTQGAQRTLRVQATVTGTASDPSVLLTSSPPRNQGEILALIGGGIVSQTEGTDASAALANFAGGSILNLLQDTIGDVFNLAEFNLSPVSTNPQGTQSSALGLAAEGAIDFSNSFSAAVRTIINDPTQPTDYSIRYRLDPTLILRGNINSSGDRGVSVEFETRF